MVNLIDLAHIWEPQPPSFMEQHETKQLIVQIDCKSRIQVAAWKQLRLYFQIWTENFFSELK